MPRLMIDGVLMTLLVLGGQAILGNLNGPGDWIFAIVFGVMHMLFHGLRRRRHARPPSRHRDSEG